MKINKKLSAAITLGLMLGMYGSASAGTNEILYGSDTYGGMPVVVGTRVNWASDTTPLANITDNVASNNDFTLRSGSWDVTWKEVFGGFSNTDDVTSNQVTIDGSTLDLRFVYGGYYFRQTDGKATQNKVTVINGTIKDKIIGGYVYNGTAESNEVNISGGTNALVYGGYVEGNGTAEQNKVYITKGTFKSAVYGGYVYGNGTADGNTVTIKGAGSGATDKVQITGNVYGGKAANGAANNNKVGTAGNAATNFTAANVYGGYGETGASNNEVYLGNGVNVDSSLDSTVYGGYVYGNGNANGNQVTISGNAEIGNVYGGYLQLYAVGNANNNILNISGGEMSCVAGGYTLNGSAVGNHVNVTGGKMVWIDGGFSGLYDTATEALYASSNIVEISGAATEVAYHVSGGSIQNGDALNNETIVKGGTIGEDVYGGYVVYEGDATGNKVNISGGTIGNDDSYVYGGYTADGKAESNQVTITGGTIKSIVIGGISENTTADSNEVTISGNSEISKDVYGGYTAEGKATNNSVTISDNSNITNKVYGGYVNEGGAANSNTVVVEGGNTGSVTGGEVFTTASGFDNTANSNTVTISVGEIAGNVTGGAAKSGNLTRVKGFANNNNIEISNNAVIRGDVKGGHTVIGDAASNEIAISDSAKVTGDVYGAFIQTKGDAANNEIAVSGGEVGGIVYGGYTKEGTAESNAVTISGGTIGSSSKFVYGGYAAEGKATSNTVTISNGTIASVVIGGHDASVADSEKFTDGNKVIISGGTVNNAVYGGSSANNNALNNSVEIDGSSTQITGNVYGGSSWGYDGIAKGNKVDVKNGTLNKNVYGGFSGADNVEENTVNISGGTIGGNVYGGESADGTANDNIVNISGTADISTAEVYGGKGTSAGTGNTLNIDTWTGSKTMKSINDFQAINVKDTREITVGVAAGLAEGGVVLDIQDSTLNLSTMGKSEKVVYLTSSGSDDFSTKFSSAKLNGYGQGEGIWRGVTTGYGVDASKAAFQIDKTQAFASVTENLLTGNLVDEGVTEELVLGSSAATFDNIYGAYSEIGTATAATVNMNVKDADLSSSTVWGNNVSADGNALKVSATGIVVKELKNFETIEADLSAGVANGDKVLTVNGEVDVKDVAISGLDAASLNKGDSVEVLNATNIKGVPAYTLDGTAVADGDIKGYTSTNANGVNVDRVAFAADTTKVALTKEDTLLTGKYIDKDGAETAGTLVLDSGAAKYDNIYGAYAENGVASAATVNLNKATNLSSSTIYGNNVSAAGNTLNVRATGNKVGGVEYFENMNFYIPDTAAAGDTMLSVNSAVDLTGVNVAAGFHNDTTLGYGDKVILIDAPSVSGMDGVSEVKVDDTDFTEYDVMVYQGDAGMNQVETGTATTLVAEMANMELKENSKVLLETVMAAATVINDGSDLLAGKTFDSAASAIAADLEAGTPSSKMSLFGAMSGNKSKVKTGSHVDVEGWNMNLGFAKELKNKNGKMILGPVVEYGRGNYDSYLDNSYHAKGDSHYVGGGFMAKQINTDGNYFEGSLRMGKVTSDFKSTGGSYDTDAKYLAGHIGVGRVQKMDAKNSMDYYAKFFHTHMDGDEVKVHAKGKDLDLTLDRSNSSRLRIGTRLNHLLGEKSAYYVGFAWQHEFNGLASGALAGKEIVSPSVKGHTGFMEMGVKLFSANQYDLDLGAIGSIGKKKGAGINLNFNFKF